MSEVYSVSNVKNMVSVVEKNKRVIDTLVCKLKKCNKKLKAINSCINIMTDKMGVKE